MAATVFFTEMTDQVFPALQRLEKTLADAEKVTWQISQALQAAEKEAAEPFKSTGDVLGTEAGALSATAAGATASLATAHGKPPPVPVPGDPSNEWKWNPDPQNSRGGTWGPKWPLPGQGQPSGSWDPEGHYDVDDGKGKRQRYDEHGRPLTPEEAHGKKPAVEPHKFAIPEGSSTVLRRLLGSLERPWCST